MSEVPLDVPADLLSELKSLIMTKGPSLVAWRIRELFPDASIVQVFTTVDHVHTLAWDEWKERTRTWFGRV